MNFGERLKQIRTDKGLTQPQFAQLAGIEQSYLSKLENDKSVPSAEMFTTILAGLEMDAASFLDEVDKDTLATTLRHIPAVSQFTNNAAAVQVKDTKKWLLGSTAVGVLGFAMMLAANDGIFISNNLYKYTSPGVVRAGEPENIFEKHSQILSLKMAAQVVSREDALRDEAAFEANRARPLTVEWPYSRGTVYFESVENGRRRFDLIHTERVQAPGNRILQYLGAIVLVCGFAGLFVEWRLRRLKNKLR
jgi:transcriptional regulator with XRE-family HTH domain